jgi:thioredoxin-like negative regulator of GroEL
MSIPTVLFFKNGEKVNQFTGAMPKDNIKVYVENILD